MSMTAALFCGQGAQFPGMGKDLYDAYPRVREIYECAGDILGMDLAAVSFHGGEAELSRTAVAQPAIYTMTIATSEAIRDLLGPPAALAGHSLGEYAALYCAGAFSLEDGFRIIKARADAMEEAAQQASGAMWAIMKSDDAVIEEICNSVDGLVMPVNYNNPGQTVIAGEEAACEQVVELLKEKGARTAKLGVASAFHTPLMQPAADRFYEDIKNIPFRPCMFEFYSNLTGTKIQISDYPDYLMKHMLSPVRFSQQIAAMTADGIDSCIEFAPKKTLATMAKKNNKDWSVTTVDGCKSIEGLEEFFQKVNQARAGQ